MKVKVGNKLYNSEKEPIMLILNSEEKRLIGNMRQVDNKFCSYPYEFGQNLVKKFMKD